MLSSERGKEAEKFDVRERKEQKDIKKGVKTVRKERERERQKGQSLFFDFLGFLIECWLVCLA